MADVRQRQRGVELVGRPHPGKYAGPAIWFGRTRGSEGVALYETGPMRVSADPWRSDCKVEHFVLPLLGSEVVEHARSVTVLALAHGMVPHALTRTAPYAGCLAQQGNRPSGNRPRKVVRPEDRNALDRVKLSVSGRHDTDAASQSGRQV